MRIVHVTRQFPPGVGGMEDVVAQLAHEQAKAGHSVRVVTLDRIFTHPHEELQPCEFWRGVEIVRIPYRGSSRYPFAPSVLGKLDRADIVHVHAIDFFFDYLAFTRPIHKHTLVATTHGGFFHTHAHARLKKLWFATVTRASARIYDAVAACSVSDFEMFEALSPGNLHLVENGVDVQKFADRASRSPVRRLVAIGRFSLNKRLDRLLDAIAELERRRAGFELDIIGAESDWTRARLVEEIATRGLGDCVRVHVGASNEEAAEIISGASLFVSASEHEGFGLSLIEALSAGLLPVVEGNAAFRAFAETSPEIAITDFSTPAVAASAIASAHDRLAADPAALRAQAMERARPYAWPGVAQRYLALYEAVRAG
jgi:alpha-1,3-mannosyltransferase